MEASDIIEDDTTECYICDTIDRLQAECERISKSLTAINQSLKSIDEELNVIHENIKTHSD